MKITYTKAIKWANNYEEVKNWLAVMQAKNQNAYYLYRFCEWCGKDPKQLLKEDKISMGKLLNKLVAVEELKNSVKFHMITAVKSYFKHNMIDLPKIAGAITVEKVKPYYMPKKDELRKLWNWCNNLRDKAFITFVCSTAIAKETLCHLQWKHFEENWENKEIPCINIPSELLKGHGRGRYKDVRQITFLTPEAKRDLINYKEWIEAKMKRKLTPEDHVWRETYAPYEPIKYSRLGKLIWDLSKASKIPFSWHDARRYVNTALEEIRMPFNWARKIRGRKVRGEEAPYSQPAIEQLRDKFKEAVPLLEFTSEKTATLEIVSLEDRKRNIIDYVELGTHLPIELKEQYIEHITKAKSHEELDNIRDAIKTALEQPKEDCQKIINEAELSQWLSKGYKFIAVLPSGKILINNET